MIDVMSMLASVGTPQFNQTTESSQSSDRYRQMMQEMLKSSKPEEQGKTQKKESEKPCTKETSDESGEKDNRPKDDKLVTLPEGLGIQSLLWIQQPVQTNAGEAAVGKPQEGNPVAEGDSPLLPVNEEAVLEAVSGEKTKQEAVGNAPVSLPKDTGFIKEAEIKPEPAVINDGTGKLPKKVDSGQKETADKKIRQILPDTSQPAELQQTEPSVGLVQQTSAPAVQSNMQVTEAGGKTEEMNAAGSAEEIEKAFQRLPEDLNVGLSAGVKEFTVQLEPERLGKLLIKASYEQGKATISIICTNEKTLQFLSGHAGELGSIMESSLGTPTNIMLDKAPSDYLNQEQNNQNGQQNGPDDSGKEKRDKQKKNDGQNFLQQLRLGLV